MESRDSEILTPDKIPTTTRDTLTTVPAMPSHTHPLAILPRRHARSDLVDHSGHLVARDARVLQPGPMSFLHKQVTMTHTTGLHLDAHLVRPWCRHLSFDHFEWRARTTNLHRRHLCHERASFVRLKAPRDKSTLTTILPAFYYPYLIGKILTQN